LFITVIDWGTGVAHLVDLDERQRTLITIYRHNYIDKGWGTGVLHLVGLDERQQTLITLYRHNYIDKGWGTGVPHLVGLNRIIASTMYMLRYPD